MSEYDKPVIEISDQSGTNLWTIPYQYEWNPLSGIPKSMTIQGWSPDSSKVYFYYSLQYDSGLPTLASARNLQSLDIHTGKIMAVLPLKPDEPTAFAFSPTISTIAYISGNSINIIDISSGAEKHAKILTDNFDDAGWIFYSPSGNKIIYHTLVSQNYFAAILEPQTMRQEIIYEWADYFLVNYAFDGWTLDEWPRYRDYKNNVSVIDLNTLSQTMIGTATPKP